MRIGHRQILFSVVLTLLNIGWAHVTSHRAHAVEYRVVDLGTLPGFPIVTPYAINASGSVTGELFSNGAPFRTSTFVWNAQSGLKGIEIPGVPSSSNNFGVKINDNGDVLGSIFSNSTFTQSFYRLPSGSVQLLGNVPTGGGFYATDLNNNSQVVGTANQHAWMWTPTGGFEDLGKEDLGPSGNLQSPWPNAINENEQMVGHITSGTRGRAFVWTRDDGYRLLPALTGTFSNFVNAIDINDEGMIVGNGQDGSGRLRGVVWRDQASLEVLDLLSGYQSTSPNAINSLGQIVGNAYIVGSGSASHAVLWPTASAEIIDLNTVLDSSGTGWMLKFATDVNDNGWITGRGSYNGAERGFVLIPVPEPGGGPLVLSAIIALVFCLRRCHHYRSHVKPLDHFGSA